METEAEKGWAKRSDFSSGLPHRDHLLSTRRRARREIDATSAKNSLAAPTGFLSLSLCLPDRRIVPGDKARPEETADTCNLSHACGTWDGRSLPIPAFRGLHVGG